MQVDVIGEDEEADREKGVMEGFYFFVKCRNEDQGERED